jgi:hypothetical protein
MAVAALLLAACDGNYDRRPIAVGRPHFSYLMRWLFALTDQPAATGFLLPFDGCVRGRGNAMTAIGAADPFWFAVNTSIKWPYHVGITRRA